jgi:hypothetical protein
LLPSTYWFPYHTDNVSFHRLVKPFSHGVQFVVTSLFFAGQFVIWGTLLASAILHWKRPFHTESLFMFAVAAGAVFYAAIPSCAVDWGEARFRSVTELMAMSTIMVAANWLWHVRGAGDVRKL